MRLERTIIYYGHLDFEKVKEDLKLIPENFENSWVSDRFAYNNTTVTNMRISDKKTIGVHDSIYFKYNFTISDPPYDEYAKISWEEFINMVSKCRKDSRMRVIK